MLVVAAVHENVLFSRVAMQVTEHDKAALLVNRLYKAFTVPDRRMKCLVGYLPSTIKIATGQAAPIITVDHAIWVKHWHDLEDKVLP